MLRDLLVRDDGGSGVLECLAAGDVVIMMIAVDQIFDWLVRDLLDFIDILLAAVRPAVGDRIRCDYAVLGDYEHRLMVAVAKDVDVLGAVDLRGLDLRPLLRLRRHAEYADQHSGHEGEKNLWHCRAPWKFS